MCQVVEVIVQAVHFTTTHLLAAHVYGLARSTTYSYIGVRAVHVNEE